VEDANKEEPYPYRISGISVWRKSSRGSSTHELASSKNAYGPGCGRMEM
jgi:hypothetical protein